MIGSRRRQRSILAATVLAALLSGTATAGDAAEAARLQTVLQRMARTASLFRDTALEFACREKINWSGLGEPGTASFEYIFVHDEDKGFRDYRTTPFLGKRRKAPEEVSPNDEGVPWYLRSAYLWVFVFRDSRQHLHHYRLVGEEEVLGIQALKIEFEPIRPIRPKLNDWYGTAWVDPELGQLLKVVAFSPQDHETKKRWEEERGADHTRAEFSTITTLFTEEHNGLRFPGKVTLEQNRHQGNKNTEDDGYKITLLRVAQLYRNYKFFSVRTKEEIENYILGNSIKN